LNRFTDKPEWACHGGSNRVAWQTRTLRPAYELILRLLYCCGSLLAAKAGIAGPGCACYGGGTEMQRDTSLRLCMIAYANPMRQSGFPVETEHPVCHELIPC